MNGQERVKLQDVESISLRGSDSVKILYSRLFDSNERISKKEKKKIN